MPADNAAPGTTPEPIDREVEIACLREHNGGTYEEAAAYWDANRIGAAAPQTTDEEVEAEVERILNMGDAGIEAEAKAPRWEPTYYLRIGWTPFEVKGRLSKVDATARELLGREVFVVMPDGSQRAIGVIQNVSAENTFP